MKKLSDIPHKKNGRGLDRYTDCNSGISSALLRTQGSAQSGASPGRAEPMTSRGVGNRAPVPLHAEAP